MAKKRPKVGALTTNIDMKQGIEDALEIGKKVAQKNIPKEISNTEAVQKVEPEEKLSKKTKASKPKKAIDRNKYRKESHKIIYLSQAHHEKAKVAAFHQRITMRQYVENLVDKDTK